MNLYILLCYEFFKTGLLAVGGGLATVPFLFDMMQRHGWFTSETLANMIAISEATPGPMGVNMATYVGYQTTGSILGSLATTFSLITPSIIIICIIAHYLKRFKDSKLVQYLFYGLRPAVCAMIATAGISIFVTTMFHDEAVALESFQFFPFLLFLIILFISNKYKKIHPIAIIFGCAIIGILFQL